MSEERFFNMLKYDSVHVDKLIQSLTIHFSSGAHVHKDFIVYNDEGTMALIKQGTCAREELKDVIRRNFPNEYRLYFYD